jgi:hypothetical protein
VKFELVQRWEAMPTDVFEVYLDPTFYAELDGVGVIGDPQVVSHEVLDTQVEMQVRFRFTGDVPSAAAKIVRPDRLTWIEDTVFEPTALRSRSTIIPDYYPDRLQCTATSRFEQVAGECVRTITGDLKVRVLLVGGQVERAIVSGMRDHFVDEQQVVATRLGL